MRKIAMLLILAMCLSFCACTADEPAQETLRMLEIHITAGKIEPGMTVADVFVEVTIDGKPVACRLELTALTSEGYYTMAEDEAVSAENLTRLDIFYSLPKGYDVDNINVTAECDGGIYDGTGSISNDAEGNIEAWSHALYGEVETPEETEPIETEPPATEPPATEPPETEPPVTEPQHTHVWTEQPGSGVLVCTADGVKTFKCSCGETKTETIPAPGHDLKEWTVTDPTCTDIGRKTTSCKRCGAGFVVELDATGHTWSDWSHKTGRVHSRICSVCHTEEEANHNIPTGSVTCTDCGADIIN